MTEDELIRLAERIAGDVQRIGLAPVILLATIDDATGLGYLELYGVRTLEPLGRLNSAREYDLILQEAREIVWGRMARA